MARSWANHGGICPEPLTNISILHILRGFNPFDIISDLVNRIDQGTDVSRNVVQQVDGRHGVGPWAKITTVIAADSGQGIGLSRLSYQHSKASSYKDRRGVLEDPAKNSHAESYLFFSARQNAEKRGTLGYPFKT
jgi:hypothetical protein